jgi:4-oxalomesaconate tautomerase
MKTLRSIPCTLFRGGTSKGPVFLKKDLPSEPKERDSVLLNLMGSPDPTGRQINGIGGGDSLSSKVVIVDKSEREGVDVDYLLCQVHIKNAVVETSLNCGNMLSAVAPFAIENGLVKASDPETTVRVYNENTGVVVESTVQTPGGFVSYEGKSEIDGVPGSGSPILLTFLDAVGSKTKKLLPTGEAVNMIDDISVSCVDVAVPMVITTAAVFGKTGYETKEELDSDKEFLDKLESLRKKASILMGLGDVSGKINPKICMVSESRFDGHINSRYFTPFDCHDGHAVSGGLCLAAACLIDGSVAQQVSKQVPKLGENNTVVIEHPSGKIETSVFVEKKDKGDGKIEIDFPKASFIRTARPLMEGRVFYRVKA